MSFSYQLYSSRNFGPIGDTLKMLKAAGYASVEGFGGLYETEETTGALIEALKDTGLSLGSTHIGLDVVESDPAGAVNLARSLDMQSVYVPFIMPDDRPTTAAGWRKLGARIEAAGKPLRDAGLGFGYHNHDFEFVETDGIIPMDALLEGGPSLEWEIDVAWVVRGNQDPLEWIDRYKDRITAAHIKDLAPEGENRDEDGWADVGHGTMDWAGISSALKATPAKHLVMEHDNPSDDKRFASRAIASVKSY